MPTSLPVRRVPDLPTLSDCSDCGICCLHMGYPSYIIGSPPDSNGEGQPAEPAWSQLPEWLKEDLLAYIASYKAPADGQLEGPCVWYDPDRRQCRHHEHRPQVCRDFQVGGQGCVDWRAYYREHRPDHCISTKST